MISFCLLCETFGQLSLPLSLWLYSVFSIILEFHTLAGTGVVRDLFANCKSIAFTLKRTAREQRNTSRRWNIDNNEYCFYFIIGGLFVWKILLYYVSSLFIVVHRRMSSVISSSFRSWINIVTYSELFTFHFVIASSLPVSQTNAQIKFQRWNFERRNQKYCALNLDKSDI